MFEEGICCIKYEMKILKTDGRSWHYDMLFAYIKWNIVQL